MELHEARAFVPGQLHQPPQMRQRLRAHRVQDAEAYTCSPEGANSGKSTFKGPARSPQPVVEFRRTVDADRNDVDVRGQACGNTTVDERAVAHHIDAEAAAPCSLDVVEERAIHQRLTAADAENTISLCKSVLEYLIDHHRRHRTLHMWARR